MKFRSTKVVDAEQWFPGKDVPGVFFYQPPPARLHDRQGGFSEFPQNPYYAIRQGDGKIFRVDPGDWIIREPDGIHYYPCKPDVFAAKYEAFDGPVSKRHVPRSSVHEKLVSLAYCLARGFYEDSAGHLCDLLEHCRVNIHPDGRAPFQNLKEMTDHYGSSPTPIDRDPS